jgi:hypothetical protein
MTETAAFTDLGDDMVVSGVLQHFSLSELEPIRGHHINSYELAMLASPSFSVC